MKIKLAVAAAIAAIAATAVAPTVVGATQPTPVIPAHQHYVINATGDLVPVGPDACTDGMSLQFDNFHFNVHRGQPFANGIISFSGCP